MERSISAIKSRASKLSIKFANLGATIYQYDIETGALVGVYDNMTQASLDNNIEISKISLVVNGKRKTAGGFYWSRVKKDIKPLKTEGKAKKVFQYTENGDFIQEWESASLAERCLNIAKGKISAVCLGNQHQTGGYRWSYEKVNKLLINNSSVHQVGKNKKCPVYQYDMNTGELIQQYESSAAAGNIFGSRTNIGRACRGQQNSAYGFYWSFECVTNYSQLKPDCFNQRECGRVKKVYQYDKLTGDFLAEHESAADATRMIGLSKGAVSAVCRGEQKSAGGYYWSHIKADSYFDIEK